MVQNGVQGSVSKDAKDGEVFVQAIGWRYLRGVLASALHGMLACIITEKEREKEGEKERKRENYDLWGVSILCLAYIHTYIHTCMHACIHTNIHACFHIYTII